jgi:hypothetical protein
MSKLVDGGHWAVGAFFLILGLDVLISSLAEVPRLVHQHPQAVTYFVVAHALVLWIPAFLCAWGVVKWLRRARHLGLALCALFGALGLASSLRFDTGVRVNGALLLIALVSCAAFAELLLPAVRVEYSRKNRMA